MDGLFQPPKWTELSVDVPSWWDSNPSHQVHVVPSMSLGGAERIVVDLANEWARHGMTADIITLHDAPSTHVFNAPGITLHQLHHLQWNERLERAAEIIKASKLPAYCHIIGPSAFKKFWEYGCETIPVVHNARNGWGEDPTLWEHDQVPYVIACGDLVADDIALTGLSKPVKVIRHMVPKPEMLSMEQRLKIRTAFGVSGNTILLGMVGRIVPQKRYTRAVRILAELLQQNISAKLVIIGATRAQDGKIARDAIEAEAINLGVRNAIVMTGPIAEARKIVGAFDVFLNTSNFEGVSIATMEAVATGIPVISADAGGQKEAIGPRDRLMSQDATDLEWADAIKTMIKHDRTVYKYDERVCHYNTWGWMNMFQNPNPNPRSCDLLFVTGNMDVGGAQRSLCNLVSMLPARNIKPVVAVCGQFGVPGFMEPALKAGVQFLDLSGGPTYIGHLRGRAGRVMDLAYKTNPKWIVFWNMDAASKITIVKAMANGNIKIADVSPGPALYKELDDELEFGRAMSLMPDDYMASLDMLVSKYNDGGPCKTRKQPKSFKVIANGVPEITELLGDDEGPTPPIGFDQNLAVVTVCRLTDSKRPDLLPLVANYLDKFCPGATLTVVGGVHKDNHKIMINPPKNLFFVGPDHRTTKFLNRFSCFYMVSLDQGCPNASLEAMMSGLPVVANPNGGTVEQIDHGVNGFLVKDDENPETFAESLAMALAMVITDKSLAKAMGEASRSKASSMFSMEKMVQSYSQVFGLR